MSLTKTHEPRGQSGNALGPLGVRRIEARRISDLSLNDSGTVMMRPSNSGMATLIAVSRAVSPR